ncbi:MAG: hypothetical protein ACK4R2_02155 [Roseateles sp.]
MDNLPPIEAAEFELKNKALCAHDGSVTKRSARIGRQPMAGAVVDFSARAGIGLARD